MKIIQIAAELASVAKVGGLGDVVYGLARALTFLEHDVSVVIPKYASLKPEAIHNLKIHEVFEEMTVWSGIVDSIHVFFLEIPGAFQGPQIYGNPSDEADYIHFSWMAHRWICSQSKAPDVIHLHDWHVSAITLFPRTTYRIVGTIHNFAYQGIIDRSMLNQYNMDFALFPGIEQDGAPNQINLLKALILYSNRVSTVSPTYAREVTHTSEGRGLEGVLKQVGDRFCGILNGLDYDFWNPQTDIHLAHHYSPSNLSNKALVKKNLRTCFGLAESSRPLVGIVTRLVPQKGVHLIEYALHQCEKYGIQLLVSGVAYDPETSALFDRLRGHFAGNPNTRVVIAHDEGLAHFIFGGSDLFLIPSLFEPCGLTQLISLRYGTIPIVRHTGGLADTIFDVNNSGKPFSETNGYSFLAPEPAAMDDAIERAVALWNESPDKWRRLQVQGMHQDFSWKNSAKQYLDLYCSL